MNKVQLYWERLQKKAEKEAELLHKHTGFQYRAVRYFNGVHIQGYSNQTGKWYTVRVVSQL